MTDVGMSADQTRVAKAVDEYCRRYNLSDCLPLSEVYDLRTHWPSSSIPHATSPGCYFFYDAQGALLYVGKTSLNNNLGRRVSSYFRNDEKRGGACAVHSGWTNQPTLIQTVGVKAAYEAPSLEEFLLERLDPPGNTRKRLRNA